MNRFSITQESAQNYYPVNTLPSVLTQEARRVGHAGVVDTDVHPTEVLLNLCEHIQHLRDENDAVILKASHGNNASVISTENFKMLLRTLLPLDPWLNRT